MRHVSDGWYFRYHLRQFKAYCSCVIIPALLIYSMSDTTAIIPVTNYMTFWYVKDYLQNIYKQNIHKFKARLRQKQMQEIVKYNEYWINAIQ